MRLLFLERDIDKALRRMALEEEKNLTETVNDICHGRIRTFVWNALKSRLCGKWKVICTPILYLSLIHI